MEDSHGKVTTSSGVTRGGGVDILNTSHVKKLLWDKRSNNTGTTRSWDKSNTDGTALTRDLARNSVWKTGVVTPVTSADWNKVHLSVDDTTTDGSSNFLSSLNTKTDVTVVITDGDVALEAGTLTSSSLLLDWHDLHDLILNRGTKDVINDLVFLDWKGEKEDLLNSGDLTSLDETTELGNWNPLVLVRLTATTWTKILNICKIKIKKKSKKIKYKYTYPVLRPPNPRFLSLLSAIFKIKFL